MKQQRTERLGWCLDCSATVSRGDRTCWRCGARRPYVRMNPSWAWVAVVAVMVGLFIWQTAAGMPWR